MIREISFRNFKSLRDVRFGLERFTVIVGPNASGKSSILQALNRLCQLFRSPAEPKKWTAQLLESLSRGADEGVELAANVEEKWYRFQSRTPSKVPRDRAPAQIGRQVGTSLSSSDWESWALRKVEDQPSFPSSVLLQLEPSKLIDPQPNSVDPSIMAPNGTGLHSALASMALNAPETWQILQDDLRRIIPTIRRLRHGKSAANQPFSLLFDSVGGDSLPATEVSEGTLLVLGLLTALHGPDRPNLILLDDLDRGLHPKAQKDLIGLLRGLMARNENLQIVATTHSPYLLDCMEPAEVRMTFLGDDGATVCAALKDHPQFEKWKDEMAPGEMWSMFGEKWLVEQEAAG